MQRSGTDELALSRGPLAQPMIWVPPLGFSLCHWNLLIFWTVWWWEKCTAYTQISGIFQNLRPDRSYLLALCCELASAWSLCCAQNHSRPMAALPTFLLDHCPSLPPSLDPHQSDASLQYKQAHPDVQHHLEDRAQARGRWRTTWQWFPVEKCFVPVGLKRITTQIKTVSGHHFIFSFFRGKCVIWWKR